MSGYGIVLTQSREGTMTYSELVAALDDFCDQKGIEKFQIEEDNYGQILLYTGLVENDEGELSVFVP
jgi:hypothetical protein